MDKGEKWGAPAPHGGSENKFTNVPQGKMLFSLIRDQ